MSMEKLKRSIGGYKPSLTTQCRLVDCLIADEIIEEES